MKYKGLIMASALMVTLPSWASEFEIRYSMNGLKQSSSISSAPADQGVIWYGEVPPEDLITGLDLAAMIGLGAGTAQNNDQGWLHVGLDGKELYIAKKGFRHSVTWNNINAVNAVDGSRQVTINNVNYKIRLMSCFVDNGQNIPDGYDHVRTHGSDWNRIMYRLHDGNHTSTYDSTNSEEPFERLANYSDQELGVHVNYGNGVNSWCMEKVASNGYGSIRGGGGISHGISRQPNYITTRLGWRPVLEKL